MKKLFFALMAVSLLSSGCFISRLFGKKDKVGCPTNGRNVGAEKYYPAIKKLLKQNARQNTREAGNRIVSKARGLEDSAGLQV